MISLDLVQLSSLRPYFSLQSVSFRAVVVWLCSVRILLFKPIGFNVFQILNLKRCQNQKLSEGGDGENGKIAQEMLNTDKNVVRKIH